MRNLSPKVISTLIQEFSFALVLSRDAVSHNTTSWNFKCDAAVCTVDVSVSQAWHSASQHTVHIYLITVIWKDLFLLLSWFLMKKERCGVKARDEKVTICQAFVREWCVIIVTTALVLQNTSAFNIWTYGMFGLSHTSIKTHCQTMGCFQW